MTRHGLGGSDVAAAIGLSPYKSPITLWQELTGRLEGFAGNEKTKWGTTLEPVIRQEYADRHGVQLIVPEHSSFDDWRRATPDGLVIGGPSEGEPSVAVFCDFSRGLEIKSVGLRMQSQWGDDGSANVPALYEVQVRWYMSILNLDRWDFAVLIGGQEYHEYTIMRDLEIEEALIVQATEFWFEHVLKDVPPPPDATNDYAHFLVERYAERSKEYVQASADLNTKLMALQNQGEQLKALTQTKKLLENEIRAELKNAAGADFALGRVNNVPVRGARKTNWQAVAEDALKLFPETKSALIERHTKRGRGHHRFYWPKQTKETSWEQELTTT